MTNKKTYTIITNIKENIDNNANIIINDEPFNFLINNKINTNICILLKDIYLNNSLNVIYSYFLKNNYDIGLIINNADYCTPKDYLINQYRFKLNSIDNIKKIYNILNNNSYNLLYKGIYLFENFCILNLEKLNKFLNDYKQLELFNYDKTLALSYLLNTEYTNITVFPFNEKILDSETLKIKYKIQTKTNDELINPIFYKKYLDNGFLRNNLVPLYKG